MTELTDRIAAVSLTTIVLVLLALTLVRGTLLATRLRLFKPLAELCESTILAITLVFLLLRPFVVQPFFIPSSSMRPTLWEGDRILVNKWVYRTHKPAYGDIVVFRSPQAADSNEKDFIKRVVGLPGDVIEVKEGRVIVGTGEDALTLTRDAIYSHLCPDLHTREELTDGDDNATLPRLRLLTNEIGIGDKHYSPEEFAAAVGRPGEPVVIQPGVVKRNEEIINESYVAEDPQYLMNPMIVPPGQLFVLGDNRNDSRDSHVWGTFSMDRVIGRADAVFWPLPHVKRISDH